MTSAAAISRDGRSARSTPRCFSPAGAEKCRHSSSRAPATRKREPAKKSGGTAATPILIAIQVKPQTRDIAAKRRYVAAGIAAPCNRYEGYIGSVGLFL